MLYYMLFLCYIAFIFGVCWDGNEILRKYNKKDDTYKMYHMYIYKVSETNRINPCVQVEDVRLSRKVLYHFAIFVIVNEILIFEDCRKEVYSAGKCKRLARYAHPASLSARGVVYDKRERHYAARV